MKVLAGIIMAALTLSSCSSIGNSYRVETDLSGTKVLIGKVPRAVLETDPAFHWFSAGYSRYAPDTVAVALLKSKAPQLRFVLFVGTWCSDSKAEVPKMFKVLDAMGIPPEKIEMFGVDRMKKSGNDEAHEFAVTKVPTLIVYSGEKEIGRIVEQPRDAVESDMSRMVRISQ